MANQYHNELGQFCSKNEMGQAIQRAQASGNIETYLSLKSDYEKIQEEEKRTDFAEREALRDFKSTEYPKKIENALTPEEVKLRVSQESEEESSR